MYHLGSKTASKVDILVLIKHSAVTVSTGTFLAIKFEKEKDTFSCCEQDNVDFLIYTLGRLLMTP